MNHPDSPLDPREEALARALHAQAETVRPVGDGLVRIRARVERRRSRTRWVVPTASAAAVVATVTAVVASGAFTSGRQSSQLGLGVASLTAATTPTVAVTTKAKRTAAPLALATPAATTTAVRPSPSAVPATSPARPTAAAPTTTVASTVAADTQRVGATPVWPFRSEAEAASWQKSVQPGEKWKLDAVQTAEHFVAALKLTGVTLTGTPTATFTDGTSFATVVLQRTGDAATPVTFASVALTHWGTGSNAPWGVVSVASPTLTAVEAAVSGPITVSVPGNSEGQLAAAVYQAGGATPVAQPSVSSSGTVAVPATGSGGAGFVVLTDTSSGGSTPIVGSLAVLPVQLTAGTAPSDTYVALENGTVNVIDAATGSVVRVLAAGTPGVGGVAVTDNGEWVYLATTKGVLRTPLDGSGAPTVVTADPATQIAVAGKNGEQLLYTYVSPSGQGQYLTWHSSAGLGTIHIGDSLPPEAETLAISPSGRQVASFVKNGMSSFNVDLFALPTATDYSQAAVPAQCSGTNGCAGATYAPDGDLVYATTDGTRVTVYEDHLGKPAKLFDVTSSTQTVTLDVDPSGSRLLMVERGTGKGWVWDGTRTTALPAGVTDASW